MKLLVIGNPIAGGGRARAQIEVLEREIDARGHAVEVFLTEKAGDAAERAGRIQGDADRLVVGGGDGTLNEVLNGLDDPGQLPIAQFPSGTANILARELGFPTDRGDGGVGRHRRGAAHRHGPGRRAAFELHLAALRRSRFDARLSADGDLHVDYRGYRVLIECKRPARDVRVEQRVGHALKQLAVRYKRASDPARTRGLVGLSVTKLVNPDGDGLRVPTWDLAIADTRRQLDEFIDRHHRRWKPDDRRTLGAIIQYRRLVYVEDENFVSPLVESALDIRPNLATEDQFTFRQFEKRFEDLPFEVRHRS